MTWVVVAFAFLFLLFLGGFLWLLRKPKEDGSLQLIQQQITSLNEQLSRSLQDVSKLTGNELDRFHQRMDQRLSQTSQMVQTTHDTVGKRLDQNSELFSQVAQRLTSLEETHKQIQRVGEEVARLQEVLRTPKLRGNLGELFLEELLAQILPTNYFTMQYRFRDGDTVDAVIHLPNQSLVPVDAKFPLENFQRMVQPNLEDSDRDRFRKAFASDFKKHVDAIAQKYIRPDESTLDFALMYVPAENIYYEAILRDERFGEPLGINAYALKKRVIPVSPNSFYAYLQAILLGLRGLRIEDRAKEIFAFLTRLQDDLRRLSEEFQLVEKHLKNATTTMEKGGKRLEKIQGRVERLDADKEVTDRPIKVVTSSETL